MVPYLITFLISILLCGCAELAMKHSRAGGVLLLGAAVLPPVFLAGARDFTVGTDIRAYGNYVFTYARFSSNPITFMWRKSDIEPAFFFFFTGIRSIPCGSVWHWRSYSGVSRSF